MNNRIVRDIFLSLLLMVSSNIHGSFAVRQFAPIQEAIVQGVMKNGLLCGLVFAQIIVLVYEHYVKHRRLVEDEQDLQKFRAEHPSYSLKEYAQRSQLILENPNISVENGGKLLISLAKGEGIEVIEGEGATPTLHIDQKVIPVAQEFCVKVNRRFRHKYAGQSDEGFMDSNIRRKRHRLAVEAVIESLRENDVAQYLSYQDSDGKTPLIHAVECTKAPRSLSRGASFREDYSAEYIFYLLYRHSTEVDPLCRFKKYGTQWFSGPLSQYIDEIMPHPDQYCSRIGLCDTCAKPYLQELAQQIKDCAQQEKLHWDTTKEALEPRLPSVLTTMVTAYSHRIQPSLTSNSQ